MALKGQNQLPNVTNQIDCYLVALGESAKPKTFALLDQLRANGLKAEKDYLDRKMKAQFKAADRLKARLQEEGLEARLLPVEWEGNSNQAKSYNVDIEITGFDRNGMLNEVLHAVTESRTSINAVSGRSDHRNKVATIHMV